MSHLETTDQLFFHQTGLDMRKTQVLVSDALQGADDGELFMEFTEFEALLWDDGHLKSSSFDRSQGLALRGVIGEATGYAHSSVLSLDALKRAVPTVRAVIDHGRTFAVDTPISAPQKLLYTDANPINAHSLAQKVALLQSIDAYARKKDPRVNQVSAAITSTWQAVQILRADGYRVADIRPLVRIFISVILKNNDRQEKGTHGMGNRVTLEQFLDPSVWQPAVDLAIRAADINFEAKPAPAGEMPVVLGNGYCGVLLHEAIGHGLEGDFNYKKSSAFAGLLGQKIAASGVTVIDSGIVPNHRGSITIDDEGTPSQENVLIKDGILKGFMHDRLSARLLGKLPTGNCRRQSYAHPPLPRMTNTYMQGGNYTQEELISSVKKGIFAPNFNSGQVDITTGKFVFSMDEAYFIENGKIQYPIKGATLIGSGPECLTKVSMIGNDFSLDRGSGSCGKAGQLVPVGVGQPSLRIDSITIGGTAL